MAVTKQEFISKIKEKYPSYASVEDNKLYDSIITKYPSYKAQITEESTMTSSGATQTTQVKEKIDPLSFRGFYEYGTKPAAKQFKETFTGIGKKTLETAKGGLGRIKEAGEGLAEGKFTIPEAATRGAAGAIQTALSPIGGVVGQAVEETVGVIPDDVKKRVMEEATPTIEGVKEWYASQSPEQQRSLQNIGVGVELLAEFVGAGQVGKQLSKQTTKQVTKDVAQETIKAADTGIKPPKFNIPKAIEGAKERVVRGDIEVKMQPGKAPVTTPIKPAPKITDTTKPTFREAVAGLGPKEKAALGKVTQKQFDDYLVDAKKSVDSDYEFTPYHKGAEKAEEAFEKLEKNLSKSSVEKGKILEKADVKIESKALKQNIKDQLKKDLNIELGGTKKAPKLTEVKGRGAKIDPNNKADLRAMQELNKVIDAKTPVEMADRISAMQNWVYNNSSKLVPGGVSENMNNFIKRATGLVNENLKNQLPDKYRQTLKAMMDDINLKNDIDRVFQVTKEGNRGELAMKRLVKGTTTSGDVRKIALAIKDKLGIDIIQEARLRHLVMELAGDTRAETLFGAIEKGGVLGAGSKILRTLGEKTFFDPEKLSRRSTKQFIGRPKGIGK